MSDTWGGDAASRQPGATRHTLAGRSGLERVLQAELDVAPAVLESIKTDLRTIGQRPEDTLELAVSLADRLLALVPRVLPGETECAVQLGNCPPQMGTGLARVLLGTDGPTMTAEAAAGAVPMR